MRKIKVIVKRPDETYGHMTWISDSLANLQSIVGGPIEAVGIGCGSILICNEEGKLAGLEPNFWVNKGKPGQDMIVGTALICGQEGEEFGDVPMGMAYWKGLLRLWGN